MIAQLEAFVAVAREGTMRQAAEELHLSQPALSARIMTLERALGTQLFDRKQHGMMLTPVGKAMLPHAARATQAVRSVEDAVRDFRLGRAGEVVIAATPAISTYVLPEIIVHFRMSYPTVRLKVRTETSEAIDELVARGDAHLGIVREHRVDYLAKQSLYSEELVLVGRATAVEPDEHRLSALELRDVPLILLDRRWASTAVILDLFSATGDPPVDTISVESVELAKQLVCHGVGYAMLPMTAVGRELETGELDRFVVDGFGHALRRVLVVERPGAASWEPLDELKSLLRQIPKLVPGAMAPDDAAFPGPPGLVSAWTNGVEEPTGQSEPTIDQRSTQVG